MRKAEAIKIHARRRFAERVGIPFGPKTEKAIIDQIQSNKAILLRKQSLRVRVYEVKHDPYTLRVVYDRNRKQIVTVLPATA